MMWIYSSCDFIRFYIIYLFFLIIVLKKIPRAIIISNFVCFHRVPLYLRTPISYLFCCELKGNNKIRQINIKMRKYMSFFFFSSSHLHKILWTFKSLISHTHKIEILHTYIYILIKEGKYQCKKKPIRHRLHSSCWVNLPPI